MAEIKKSRKGIGGPKTEAGKRRSSVNAVCWGNYARTEAGKQRAEELQKKKEKESGVWVDDAFCEIHEAMRHHYKPKDAVEDEMVRRIARCLARLRVTESMEGRRAAAIRHQTSPDGCYVDIMRFERLVDIHLHRAIRTLMKKGEAEQAQTK